jgi:very-short-patch-repair endonuclease
MDAGRRTTGRVRGTPRQVDGIARELRRNMTAAERLLWAAMRDRQIDGLKFRRQHPIGPFILDFCCPAQRLVIEVDGGVHDDEEQAAHDALRTDQLAAYGYRVLRVRNDDVMRDLAAVIETIRRAAAGS